MSLALALERLEEVGFPALARKIRGVLPSQARKLLQIALTSNNNIKQAFIRSYGYPHTRFQMRKQALRLALFELGETPL